MNLEDAVKRSCLEPTLIKALGWIAIWETERVIQQVREFDRTGVSTASHGGSWDTCFEICFARVLDAYPKPKKEPFDRYADEY